MAATYGELTGLPGACVVTRGPGAASAVNGVAHALLDRAPMLVVTDAVPTDESSRVSRQRLDQPALFDAVAKWSVSATPQTASAAVEAAVRIACAPPAGPVHVNVDSDAGPALSLPPTLPSERADAGPAEDLVESAERPVVAVGVGARRAAESVRRALRQLSCPILTTYKAKGIVRESAANAAGFITGATIEAETLERADLIVAIGLDPVEFIPASWDHAAPVLSLAEWVPDSDYFSPAFEIVGPLESSLHLLEPLQGLGAVQGESGFERLKSALDLPGEGLLAQDVVRAARVAFSAGAIATIDSGAHMFPAMTYWTVEAPGEALISCGLATMGFALPAAIAAAHLNHDRRVVCFTGDGGLGMTLGELETAARYSLPIVVVVLNDAALSLIEVKQRESQGGENAVRHLDVDFAIVARGLGLDARRVETLSELEAALRDAARADGPFLIDAVVDPTNYAGVLSALRGGPR